MTPFVAGFLFVLLGCTSERTTSTTAPAPTVSSTSTPSSLTTSVAVSGSSQGKGIWREISPPQVSIDPNNPANNYGFNTVAIDPTDPSILFVGTDYQGLWKSIDGGGTWAKLNTGSGGDLLDQGRVWALAVDPFDHNTLWATAGYGAGGPLKSIDGGVSWTKVAVGSPTQSDDVYSIYLDPYTPNHMLVAWHSPWSADNTNSGVSESSDGGTSWINHQPPAGSAWGAGNAAWFLDNSESWLLGSQNDGIWRTTDSGSTWAQVLTDPMNHGGVNSLVKIGSTYYLATSSGVHTSTDGGAKLGGHLHRPSRRVLRDGCDGWHQSLHRALVPHTELCGWTLVLPPFEWRILAATPDVAEHLLQPWWLHRMQRASHVRLRFTEPSRLCRQLAGWRLDGRELSANRVRLRLGQCAHCRVTRRWV